jgi:8-oxo-dGTP diphosphatase
MSTHAIGAFAIIVDTESRILLCHRRDLDMWNLPGGRVEVAESPWSAVVREVEEEVGLLVRMDRLLGVYAVPARSELAFNFLCVPIGGAVRLSDEADDIQWFNQAHVPPNTLPRQLVRIGHAFAQHSGVLLETQAY